MKNVKHDNLTHTGIYKIIHFISTPKLQGKKSSEILSSDAVRYATVMYGTKGVGKVDFTSIDIFQASVILALSEQ